MNMRHGFLISTIDILNDAYELKNSLLHGLMSVPVLTGHAFFNLFST